MPREYTKEQLANMEAKKKRPIYLVELQLSGTIEYLSCCDDEITFDGDTYTAGGFNLTIVRDSRSASGWIPSTAAYATNIEQGDWRRGVFRIHYIPALDDGTVSFNAAAGFKNWFDGIIDSPALQGNRITVTGLNKYLTGEMSPVFTFDQVCNHLPPAGSTIEWEGETVVLEPPEEGLVVGGSFTGYSPGTNFQYYTSA